MRSKMKMWVRKISANAFMENRDLPENAFFYVCDFSGILHGDYGIATLVYVGTVPGTTCTV